MTLSTFTILVWIWIGIALLVVPIALRVTAPYGRHTNRSWGKLMDNRLGWMIMEGISPLVFALCFLSGPVVKTGPMWFFFALWMAHYINRSLIFPLRTKTKGKKIPLAIVGSAIFFNMVNGSLNGYFLGWLSNPYPESWWSDPRLWIGFAIFLFGAGINLYSDEILLSLRKPGETGYKIPKGGFFRWVSCPNHLGEIIEWIGFAIMVWNFPALSFAIWTPANLIPRALSHHKWYKTTFPEYPANRKAIIPKIL